ncbi:MAG: lipoprotein insertase outer membrane protein LolB [Pseudomonadota bacterium]
MLPAMRHRRRILLALVLGTLCACAPRGVQELPLLVDWSARQQILSALQVWSLRGRVNIRTADDNSSGSLVWEQDAERFRALIDGPLGIGGLRIVGDPAAVTISGGRIETTTVADPARELLRQTGVAVPVNGLRYWLLGIPIPGIDAAVSLTAQNVAQQIDQQGWSIQITEYRRWNLNLLPRKLIATSGDTRLMVVVGDWDIREQSASKTMGGGSR